MSTQTVKWMLLVTVLFASGCFSWFKMPMTKAAEGTDFLTFHHPPMGLTLSYPADWRLETRDMIKFPPTPENLPEGYSKEEDTEGYKTFGNQITLYAPTFKDKPLDEVYIFINTNRVSASGDLETVIKLQHELSQVDSNMVDSIAISLTKSVSVTKGTPEGVDDALAVAAKSPFMQSAAIWLAKDELIFGIATASDDPEVVALMHEIVATFKFDGTTQELSEKYKKYTVDADALRIAIEASRLLPQPECDIVCRDAKESGAAPDLSSSGSQSTTPQPLSSPLQAAAVNVSGNQKVLPANWVAPVLPTTNPSTWNVACGSSDHTGNAEFALDIGAYQYHNVFAAVTGTVREVTTWNEGGPVGYGRLVRIETSINLAGGSRAYHHAYAHLDSIAPGIIVNQAISKGAKLGEVGKSGTSAVHLHFHARDASNNPVELTPLLGFSSNTNYPGVSASCGTIDYAYNDTIVVESAAFTAQLNQNATANDGSAKYWSCINPTGATVECYMKAFHATNGWFTQVTANSPPQLQYNNIDVINSSGQNPTTFYIWTCGHASTGGDDSIWVDSGSKVVLIVQTPQWTWLSQQFNTSARPTITWSTGNRTLNVWMREDDARLGRILLARNASYNPNNSQVRCGSY